MKKIGNRQSAVSNLKIGLTKHFSGAVSKEGNDYNSSLCDRML